MTSAACSARSGSVVIVSGLRTRRALMPTPCSSPTPSSPSSQLGQWGHRREAFHPLWNGALVQLTDVSALEALSSPVQDARADHSPPLSRHSQLAVQVCKYGYDKGIFTAPQPCEILARWLDVILYAYLKTGYIGGDHSGSLSSSLSLPRHIFL